MGISWIKGMGDRSMSEQISLFVPGRLCMFGEHSDWAGLHRMMNSDIERGMAIVTGIEEGIYAKVQKAPSFIVRDETSENPADWTKLECDMSHEALKKIAQTGGYYSYVAGVASYISEWYHVGGVEIVITKQTLPLKSGLSSSAAICVLVTRAFNILYQLNLNTLGEMNIAFLGEQRTPSRCGRLDQACAFGVHPVRMTFDGNEISVDRLIIKRELNWVISDLNASKDTIQILSDLNKCYPFPRTDMDHRVHEALGRDNLEMVERAIEYMRTGEVEKLGQLMTEAQKLFDEKIAPASIEQLTAPVLHSMLADETVKSLSYGGKGVGSQGDGSVQFLAKNAECQTKLVEYLCGLGLHAHKLTIQPKHIVRKAVIPVAGFGTRMYPATRMIKKEFMPIVDTDGLVKPIILMILEQLLDVGIEEICLVVGSEADKEMYKTFFDHDLEDEHFERLSKNMKEYERKIKKIGGMLRFVVQKERKGFGHAVYQARKFVNDEPVLLLLGDTVYKSTSSRACSLQMIDAYETMNTSVVSLHKIPLDDVVHYGVLTGTWEDSKQTLMKVTRFTEKPSREHAQDFLNTPRKDAEGGYYGVFGQYILTPDVFRQLEEDIQNDVTLNGEIQLTHALEQVGKKVGLTGLLLNGEMFDIGNAEAYRNTVKTY